MARPHKNAGVGLDISTSLTPEEILGLAKRSLEGLRGGLANEMSARIAGDYPMSLSVSIRGAGALREMMAFTVNIVGDAPPRKVRTVIENYRTTQQRIYYIPVAPKRMMGFSLYKAFVQKFATAIKAQDPNATVVGLPS